MVDIQPGEVEVTWADTSALNALTGFVPATTIEEGIGRFAAWYLDNPDATLVADRRDESAVKKLVERLRELGLDD